MDAVQYLKEKARMTNKCSINCMKECGLSSRNNNDGKSCRELENIFPAEAVRIVEEWSKAHPIMTRAEKFKEVFGIDPESQVFAGRVMCPPRAVSELYCDPPRECVKCKVWWNALYEAPKGE